MLTVLDLFSGIGGFSLGLERTGGFKTIAFCEIDPFCRRVLNKHWPEVPVYEDVTTLTPTLGFSDVICGGFPCQDISIAGHGAGLDGTRSGLWKEYSRIIGDVRPRFVIVENVGALLHRGLDAVLRDLAALGYDAEWHCIPASAVGAPHLRDRVWVIAYPAESEGVLRHDSSVQRRRARETEQDRLGHSQGVFADSRQKRAKRFFTESVSRFPSFSWCENVRRVEDLRGRSDIPEPIFRGGRDGVPDWMDRLGALGNAVVPQIPELIGRAILQAEAAL